MTFTYIKREDGLLQCPHCDYAKQNMSTVHMHIKAKHTDAPKPVMKVLDLSCPCCDFTCKQMPQLRSHYVTQHLTTECNALLGEKNTCLACQMQFKSRAAFMYHTVKCLPADIKEDTIHAKGLCVN